MKIISLYTQIGGLVSLKIYTAILSFICLLGFTYASTQPVNSFLSKFKNVDKKATTFNRVDYSQTYFFKYTKEKQKIEGTIFLKNGSIYIAQRAPQEQHIHIDGKNITIYTPVNKQAIVDNWKNVIDADFTPATIVNFRNNWKEIEKTSIIELEVETQDHVVVVITPIKNKNWNVKMYISKTTLNVNRVIMDSQDVAVEFIFKNYVVSPLLDENMFKLNVPGDVEIIKLN